MSCCREPNFTKVNKKYICLNCLFTEEIIEKKSVGCCDNKNIIKNRSEFVCTNCATIHGYQYVSEFRYDDYNLIVNNMLKYKKNNYNRKKYLINKCRRIDYKIICFLDESLEKLKI